MEKAGHSYPQSKSPVFFAVLALLSIGGSTAVGKTIHVKAGGTGDGSSWASAYGDLQTALDDAEPNDSIWVAEGIYIPTKLFDPCDPRSANFQLKNYVGIYGGFSEVGDPNWEDRDWQKYETVLSGDLLGNDIDVGDPCDLINAPCRADNCYHVFYHLNNSNLDPNAVLDGFRIASGNADGEEWQDPNSNGGGMFNYECSPTVTNCTFSCNLAAARGGGMTNFDSSPKVIHCTFSDNWSGLVGGGIFNAAFSRPIITNCTFTNNWSWAGGGIYNQGFNGTTVTNCTFSNNTAGSGGGMCNGLESRPTVTNCAFIGNRAEWDGGGIDNHESRPTLTGCTFSGNTAGRHGGGICDRYSHSLHSYDPTTVTHCTFIGNLAEEYGGAICTDKSGDALINNCTFVGNSAADGGGICVSNDSYAEAANCTLVGNSAYYGCGIYCDQTWSYAYTYNCILWGNIAQTSGEVYVTWSDIQGGHFGPGNIDTDPLFVDPDGPDNIPGTEDDNLHLLPYSPCIDAGDPTKDYTNRTDMDGQQRLLYDRVDIGADEVFPIAGDIDGDGDVDFADFAYFSGHWLKGK